MTYEPKDANEAFWKFLEEIGEVMQAAGKIGRFGPTSKHPDEFWPYKDNEHHFWCEFEDLQKAMNWVIHFKYEEPKEQEKIDE